MNKVLPLAAAAEAATGLALLVVPSLVGQLLLGHELTGISIVVGRVAGIALLALGIACWSNEKTISPALTGMLTYGLLVTLYLMFIGIRGEWVGPLLWPVVVLHAVITIFLGRAWLMSPKTGRRNNDASK